jgi:hypothetical protein
MRSEDPRVQQKSLLFPEFIRMKDEDILKTLNGDVESKAIPSEMDPGALELQ